jgi:WD40 repeat protein
MAIALLLLSGLKVLSLADEQPKKEQAKKVTSEEIDRLVKELGNDDFTKRTEAKKQLEEIGAPAMARLKTAAKTSTDAEIRTAAEAIIEVIERRNNGALRVFEGHGNRVNGVAISGDGKRALSASWDSALRLWNLENGELVRMMKGHTGSLMSVALSADGKRALSSGSDQTMRLWNVETGEEIRSFAGHPATVWDVIFSPDGKKALSGCGDGIARLWDLESGKELLALETHTQMGGVAWTAAFTPNGKQAVTGGGNLLSGNDPAEGSLRLWDLTTGKEIRQFKGHTKDIRCVAISPDGKRLLSGSFDGTMRLWDIETAKELKRFAGPGNFVESVRFTPAGTKAICSYGPRVVEAIYDEDPRCSLRLWDLASGKELHQFKGHTGPVLSLAISGNGRFLVSGSGDNTMRLWKMPE